MAIDRAKCIDVQKMKTIVLKQTDLSAPLNKKRTIIANQSCALSSIKLQTMQMILNISVHSILINK